MTDETTFRNDTRSVRATIRHWTIQTEWPLPVDVPLGSTRLVSFSGFCRFGNPLLTCDAESGGDRYPCDPDQHCIACAFIAELPFGGGCHVRDFVAKVMLFAAKAIHN